ncbi:MAG: thiolase family protein [Candidatus Bipolaricaulia bacterium]
MTEVVIVDAVRTPTGRFQGALAEYRATDLGAKVIAALKERNGLKGDDLDEVILGQVVQAGAGQAPARQAAIRGGLSPEVPAFAVNKVCGSATKAVILAAQAIKAGDAKAIIAGGMESMTNAPYALPGARAGFRLWDQQVKDLLVYDGLWCNFEDRHMGLAAEYTAKKSGISREEQDRFAYESHMKAARATEAGKFKEELIPIPFKDGLLERDETIRPDTALEKLAKLKPVFQEGGTVTAGNSPGLCDGASAVLVMAKEEAKRRGLRPLAELIGYAVVGVEPRELFYGPVFATRMLMKKLGVEIDFFDLIEINEAFAAQTLADGKELGWDWQRVNVNGGALALGHAIGSSGTRILTTLIYELRRRGLEHGLTTICMGGGTAASLAIRAV